MSRVIFFALTLVGTGTLETSSQEQRSMPTTGGRPESWSNEVLELFFDDARNTVVGLRPDYRRLNGTTIPRNGKSGTKNIKTGRQPWSQLITADTIETEIKRMAKDVARDSQSAGPFKSGGYKLCRRHFTTLAALFAVVAEYDAEVRWQSDAADLRDMFANAAQQCSKGTDESFRVATERAQDLADLVRGQSVTSLTSEAKSNWIETTDLAQLMQRMELATPDHFSSWLSSDRTMRRNQGELVHQSQVLAMLGQIIQQSGFEYWDDETYTGYALALTSSATDLAVSSQESNLEDARSASVRIGRSCADCHEGYRG